MGGSGGGGGSGKVDYPEYMKTYHEGWLGDIDTAMGASGNPYASKNAPAITALTNAGSANTDFLAYLNGRKADIEARRIETPAVMLPLITGFVAEIDNYINELRDIDDITQAVDLETVIYPRFDAGMRDVNAVQTSSYVLGRSLIESNYAAQMVKTKHELIGEMQKIKSSVVATGDTIRAGYRQAYDGLLNQLDPLYDALYARVIDFGRLHLIALNEQATMDADFDDKSGRWTLENFQYAANMLAAIGGGTSIPGKGTNKAQSALAGGLSGAAAGAMIGGAFKGSAAGPIGAGVGAMLGIGAALLG